MPHEQTLKILSYDTTHIKYPEQASCIETESRLMVAQGRGEWWEVAAYGYGVCLGEKENIKLDCGDGCTI